MAKVSLEKEKIKILLLEGLHPSSVEVLQAAGYTNIEYHKGSLSEEELIEAVKDMPIENRPKLQMVAFDNRTIDDLGEPDIVNDIDGYTDRKMDVMAAHRSQTGKLLEDLAADTQQGDDARNRWMKYENFYSYEID